MQIYCKRYNKDKKIQKNIWCVFDTHRSSFDTVYQVFLRTLLNIEGIVEIAPGKRSGEIPFESQLPIFALSANAIISNTACLGRPKSLVNECYAREGGVLRGSV